MNEIPGAQATEQWKQLLYLILVVGLVIRLCGVDYGLPFSYWNDEYHEVMRAMQLGAGSFNIGRTTKGGFYLLLFVEYGFYFVALKVAGVVSGTREFAELFVRDPSMFYLIGRSTAAVLGCITVWAVYRLSRFAYSNVAGLFAAMLLAVNVLHVDVSHKIGVDVPMTMLATLSLYFGIRVAAAGGRRDYVLAAIFASLATTTKLPGVLLLLPLLIAHTYVTTDKGTGARGWLLSKDLWIAAAIFVVLLLATNPGFILYTSIGNHLGLAENAIGGDEQDALLEQNLHGRPNLYFFYVQVLLESMGWPLFLVSLAAIGYACLRRSRADVILLSYALVNYLVIASTSAETLYYPRYALPIIVVLVALVGRALSDLLQQMPHRRLALSGALFVILAAWPAYQSVMQDYSLLLVDTRTIAKNWFEANVRPGAKVLVEGGKTGPKRESVQLRESRKSLERRIEYWRKFEPRQAKFLEVKLATQNGTGYDLELVRLQSIETLDRYAAVGVEYFVVRPEYFLESRKAVSNAARLLEQLRTDPRVTLIHRFAPESRWHPGTTVEIYRLNRAGHLVQG
jgi:hypothetical protein